jgi:VWFA-related protein
MLASAALAVTVTVATSGQGPSFRTGIELVSLNVTVTDAEQKYVTNLDQPEFNVFEDGVKQDITYFNRTRLPIALVVLLDTSASMQEKLPTAQEAAVGFVKRLGAKDEAMLIDFDSRVDILHPFSNDQKSLETAIRRTTAGGSTSLHNAIYISLKELKKNQAKSTEEVRRQAIVVLSDGEDTSSLVSLLSERGFGAGERVRSHRRGDLESIHAWVRVEERTA